MFQAGSQRRLQTS